MNYLRIFFYRKPRGITKPKRSRSRTSEESKLPQSTTIVYKCEICKIQSNSLFQLKDHLKGKRHKMAAYENSLKENREVAKNFDDMQYNLKIVSSVFFGLGVSIINFLYTFFRIIDIKYNDHLFYFWFIIFLTFFFDRFCSYLIKWLFLFIRWLFDNFWFQWFVLTWFELILVFFSNYLTFVVYIEIFVCIVWNK